MPRENFHKFALIKFLSCRFFIQCYSEYGDLYCIGKNLFHRIFLLQRCMAGLITHNILLDEEAKPSSTIL